MQQLAKDYMTATRATVRHALAHVQGSDEYCERDFVSDGVRGLEGQIHHVLTTLLDDDRREAVADALGVDGWAELSMMLGEPALSVEPWEGLHWSDLADAIEANSDLYWEDGDVFRRVECYMLDGDGEFMLGQDDLAVDVLRDEDGDVAHLRVTWGLGGPNVFLIRDWGGDRLVVNWDTRETWYDEDVTDLLDAYVETFTY